MIPFMFSYWVTIFLLFWVMMVPWIVVLSLLANRTRSRMRRLWFRWGVVGSVLWVLLIGVGIWLPVFVGGLL